MTNPPVRIVELICTENATRGKGTDEDPHRTLTQYWTKDGVLVFEIDPYVIPLARYRWTPPGVDTEEQIRAYMATRQNDPITPIKVEPHDGKIRVGKFHAWPLAEDLWSPNAESKAALRSQFSAWMAANLTHIGKSIEGDLTVASHPSFEPIDIGDPTPIYELHAKHNGEGPWQFSFEKKPIQTPTP